MQGYIKLSRSFFENPFWNEDRMFSKCEAWLDLIQTARIEQSSAIVNGKVVELQRGQLCASIRFLAKRWSWGEQKVRTYLITLKNLGMITQHQHNGETVVTLVKYRLYNDSQHSKEAESNTAITQRQHSDNTAITQSIITKEFNNEIKEKENITAIAEPPPKPKKLKFSLDKYLKEKKLPFESEIFLQKFKVLLEQQKWKNKPESAVLENLEQMKNYEEEFVLQQISKAISSGWQGWVYDGQYENYKKYNKNLNDKTTGTTVAKTNRGGSIDQLQSLKRASDASTGEDINTAGNEGVEHRDEWAEAVIIN